MVLLSTNKAKQLLRISYIGQVRVDDFLREREDLVAQLAGLPRGFRVLTDLSGLEAIDPACVPEIGHYMDLVGQAGVSLVVRVIPDPSKDIGMKILTEFHYPMHPRVVTCESLIQAMQVLEL